MAEIYKRIMFIENPNLPKSGVTLAVIQKTTAADKLTACGIKLLHPIKNSRLANEVSSHPDMLLFHAGGRLIFLEPEQKELAAALAEEGFEVRFTKPLSGEYPKDIALNIAAGRDFALGLLEHNCPAAKTALEAHGRALINTRQGYAKCSLCFVTERAFITEDSGIAALLQSRGFDVLNISKGDIFLSGSHYGFFGGCAGKISENTLAVNGSLSYHRDGDRIAEFAKKHGVEILQLTGGKITDIGGILPLKIKEN